MKIHCGGRIFIYQCALKTVYLMLVLSCYVTIMCDHGKTINNSSEQESDTQIHKEGVEKKVP